MSEVQAPKGFKDFLPDKARIRESVISTLKEVFSLFGFSPLETPAIEYASTLLNKYGEEADKLIYLFKDRGGREIGLRYDLTVPLARVVSEYQNDITIPFKRYQVTPVWRADKPQAGRYREFWQADIDIVGSNSALADAEVIGCALTALNKLGLNNYKLFINDRKFFDSIGITPQLATILDKADKIGKEAASEELRKKIGSEADVILEKLQSAKEPETITKLKSIIETMGINISQITFDPWLARGLEYYTGIIFELRIEQYGNLSIGAGGRYDKLIGQFIGRDLPAVGFSFGIDRLIEALEQGVLIQGKGISAPEILVTVFNPDLITHSIKATSRLRSAGMQTEVYLNEDVKLDKQLKYANTRGINTVVIIGPEEVNTNSVVIKDMTSGEQRKVPQDQLLKEINK